MNLKIKNAFIKILGLSFLALQLSACGSATDNIDILNSTSLPVINSYLSTGVFTGGSTFSTTAPYWTYNSGTSFYSPARGVVGEIGASSIIAGTSFVTILHSGRVATRIHGIVSLSVRSGDAVTAGQLLGTNVGGSTAFQILVDGAVTCPLSYINSTLRFGLVSPCQ